MRVHLDSGFSDGGHKIRTGPVPEIGRLLAKNPQARIAIVQGSFDWFHSGHQDLVDNVASKGYDLVVVLPTRVYEKKPYLRSSYERRLKLAKDALQDRPDVVVSDGTRRIEGHPAQIMMQLVADYPGAKFSYCLGGDSFDESKAWPQFDFVEKHKNIEFVAVGRGGHKLEDWNRADTVISGTQTTISSTELRRALADGDLKPIADRVPPSTLKALQSELQRRQERLQAGQKMLGMDRPSELSFSALREQRPANGVDILKFVGEDEVTDDVRQHLANVQGLLNKRAHQLKNSTFSVAKKQLPSDAGLSDKTIYDARTGMRLTGRILHKTMGDEKARKVEFATVLANVLGMPTEPAVRHKDGVAIAMVDDVRVDKALHTKLGSCAPKVLQSMVLSRWTDQLLGNLDSWSLQFLLSGKGDSIDDVMQIDLDESFDRFDKDKLYDALVNHFKLEGVEEKDAVWRDQRFSFTRAAGLEPDHYDSTFTLYGPLFGDYVTGKIDINLDQVEDQVRFASRIPRAAILNAMQSWLDTDSQMVTLPAHDPPEVSKAEFQRMFVERLERSIGEFCGFLGDLKAARGDTGHPLYKHFSTLPKRPY